MQIKVQHRKYDTKHGPKVYDRLSKTTKNTTCRHITKELSSKMPQTLAPIKQIKQKMLADLLKNIEKIKQEALRKKI